MRPNRYMNGDGTFSRREFLKVAAAGAAAGGVASTGGVLRAAAVSRSGPLIIDCHAHLYSEDESRYPPIENPYRPPGGCGTLAHLRKQMAAAGVRFATAVQTSSFYRWDNRFIADSALACRDTLVGICTLDPDNPESPELLSQFVRNCDIRGLRSIPGRDNWLDAPGVDALWTRAEELGITINVLTNRDQRSELEALVGRHPQLPVVIDHCLNLSAGPQQNAILADMIALARFASLHAKLSFVVTGSGESFPFRDMHEPCKTIIKAYGPERCVWGSDFPCELWCPKATYAEHLRVFTDELRLDAESKRLILGETAKRLYLA